MTRTTEANIERALVQTVRAQNAAFDAVVAAGDAVDPATGTQHTTMHGIHEGNAPASTPYPFLTYNMVAAPYEDDWTKRTIVAAFDVEAWSDNSVEAKNLDSLAMNVIEDNLVAVTGQNTLLCRRVEGIRIPETDETGRRIYRRGGTYAISTDQPL